MTAFSTRRASPVVCAAASLIALVTLFVPEGHAQTGTSSVRGQVLDAQVRAIPGARVEISDENMKVVRSQVTDATGEFSFAGIPPAIYRLEAEAPGFKKLTIERVTATVSVTTEVPMRLELGDVTRSVRVATGQEPRLWRKVRSRT
jgi:hypothetical protein